MIAFFVTLALLSSPQLARSTGIFLSLFTDEHCSTPSTTNPNVTLGINVCAVTSGLESFIYTPVACTTGFAKAWVFTDVGCAKPVDPDYYYPGESSNDYCYAAYIPGVFPALMLTCDADANEVTPSRPTSTTTIAVGPVVNAATSATAGGSTATEASSAGSTTASTGTGTGTGTGAGTGTGTSTSTSTSTSNATGWNSLDYGTRVGIIVAIAVGVPPIPIGLYALKRSGRLG